MLVEISFIQFWEPNVVPSQGSLHGKHLLLCQGTLANNITAHLKTVLYLCNYFSGDGFYLQRYPTKTFSMNPDTWIKLIPSTTLLTAVTLAT